MRKTEFGVLTILICFLAALVMVSCSSGPDAVSIPEPGTKPVPLPPAEDVFTKKPYHEAMGEEMRISYEQADEIVIGLYSGSHKDEALGHIHYFDNFKTFNKTTLSWGEEMKAIMQIQAGALKPEIIKKNEYFRLSDLDKVGICWDPTEQSRYVYLVEGQKMLVFLQTGYDETNNRSYRNLIDSYPVTPICRADYVFELVVRNF